MGKKIVEECCLTDWVLASVFWRWKVRIESFSSSLDFSSSSKYFPTSNKFSEFSSYRRGIFVQEEFRLDPSKPIIFRSYSIYGVSQINHSLTLFLNLFFPFMDFWMSFLSRKFPFKTFSSIFRSSSKTWLLNICTTSFLFHSMSKLFTNPSKSASWKSGTSSSTSSCASLAKTSFPWSSTSPS